MHSLSGEIILPPSPNWFGSHLADLAPEHHLCAYAAHNSVVLLDTRVHVVVATLAAHFNRLDDGCLGLVTGGADRMLRLWCVDSRRCLRTISKRPADAAAIVAAWGGCTALVGDRGGSLLAWDLGATKAPRLAAASRQGVAVACLAAGPCPASSSLVSVGWADGAVSIVDWRRDEVLARLRPHRGDVHSVRWARFPPATEAPTAVATVPDASESSAATAAALIDVEPRPALAATAVSGAESVAADASAAAQAAVVTAEGWEIRQHMEHGQQKPCHPALQQAHQQPGVLMLVSSGADCSMHVHALAVTAAAVLPAAASEPGSSGASSAPRGSALAMSSAHVCSLHLPKPQSGLTQAQQTRVWFTAAWVPWAAGGNELRTRAWLLSSGYGGSILAWQVPLPAPGTSGAAVQGRVPPPVRLPILHGRPVFTIHAALLGGGGRTPDLTLLTTSMDRAAKQWALPLPSLAPSAEGSSADSRVAAGGAWGDSKEAAAAWKRAKPVWSVCGLGGFAYSLSLQPVAAAAAPDGEGEPAGAGSALLAVACGDRTVRLLPLVDGVAQQAQQVMLWGGLAGTAAVIAWLPAGLGGASTQQPLLAFGCKDGSVGLMMTQRNQSVLMPVKHKGSVLELRWAAASDGSSALLWSLSADGALLQWGPWADVADLLPATKTGGGGLAPAGATASAPSTQAAAAAAALQPADLGAALAALDGGLLGEAPRQLSAFDAPPAGLAGEQHLALVGCTDGGLALFRQPAGGAWSQAAAHRPSPCLGPSAAVVQARLSPGSDAVAWADEGRRIWVRSLAAGAELACLLLPAQPTVLAWQPAAGAAPGADPASSGGCSCGLLAVALADNTARLLAWWAGELADVGRLRGHSGAVRSLAWLGRGTLLSGGEDQSVRRWRVEGEVPQLVEAARAAAARTAAQAGETAEAAAADSEDAHSEASEISGAAAPPAAAEVQARDASPETMPGSGSLAACEAQPAADAASLDQAPPAGAPSPPVLLSEDAAGTATRAATLSPAPSALTGAEARRKGKESLGARALLRPAGVAEGDAGQQAGAQEACVRLARSLLAPPGAGADFAAADAVLLDCAPDPLAASLLLRDAAAALAAAAGTGSTGARHSAAQRSATLSLWRGDPGAALDVLISREALTSDFVSLAAGFGPGGSPPAWRAVARLHVQGLEEGGEAHGAALHLLALGEAEAAARLLARAGLLREAVLLASVRLLPAQAPLLDLRRQYASQLAARGQAEQAAAQLLAARGWAAGAAALLARGTRGAAHAAACVCGEVAKAVAAGSLELDAEEGAALEAVLEAAAAWLAAAPLPREAEPPPLLEQRTPASEPAAGVFAPAPPGSLGTSGWADGADEQDANATLSGEQILANEHAPGRLAAEVERGPAAAMAAGPDGNGSRGRGPRLRYSPSELIELREGAGGPLPTLPPDLLLLT